MEPLADKPAWARNLPHGAGILLLEECQVAGDHLSRGRTVLARTRLGAALKRWPSLWGLEILAQAAACLPVHGRIDGPRQGYLVKADEVRFNAPELPAEETLEIMVERTTESSGGLNICTGRITRSGWPGEVLLEARFYLWNKAA